MEIRPAAASEIDRQCEIVALARAWLGTPYHHQMSVQGAGTDCLGLVRGIWRELYGDEPQTMPAYSRDWAEASGEETLLDAARRHFAEIEINQAKPGDILVFRHRPHLPAKHVGILSGPLSGAGSMIHASESGPVCEITLSAWWRRRIAAAFVFPESRRSE
jgi:NlpC/P60 family putative phage cell wall peptidase